MANGIVLSIGVPTIIGREIPFNRLINKLNTQLQEQGIWNEVEIVTECDDRTMSIGNKRQLLLTRTYGDFVSFIDDDDNISDDYCITLWRAIKDNPDADCIGFLQKCIINGGAPKLASLSNQWDNWSEKVGVYDYVRCPFFPNAIRREHCMTIGYEDLRFGEDFDFSMRLKAAGLIKNEVFIDKILYNYEYVYVPNKYKAPVK